MHGSKPIGFPQILKVGREGQIQDYESSSGSLRGRSDTRTCQKISSRRWPVFGPLLRVDYRLSFANRYVNGIAPFLLACLTAEGVEKQRMFRGV